MPHLDKLRFLRAELRRFQEVAFQFEVGVSRAPKRRKGMNTRSTTRRIMRPPLTVVHGFAMDRIEKSKTEIQRVEEAIADLQDTWLSG